jgi:hypothetical protein
MIVGAGVGAFLLVRYMLNKRNENEAKSNAGGSSTDQCCYDYDTNRCGVVEGACSDYGYSRSNCCAKRLSR